MRPRSSPILPASAIALAALLLLGGISAPDALEVTGALPVTVDGSQTSPDAVRIQVPGEDGKNLLEVSVLRTGIDPAVLVTLSGVDEHAYEVRGTLLVIGDLLSTHSRLEIRHGTTQTFAANIHRTATYPSIDAWVNGTDHPQSFHLEPALRYRSTSQGIQEVAVMQPEDGSTVLVFTRTAGGFHLQAAGEEHTFAASDLGFTGDIHKGPVTFTLRDLQGGVVQTILVDRESTPARVVLSGAHAETLQGPMSFQGPPANPTRIAIYDADGVVALSYATTPDGKASLKAGDETLLDDMTFLRMQGSPTDRTFKLMLQDADGETTEVVFDRDAMLANLGLPPEAQEPVVLLLSPLDSLAGAQESYLLRIEDARPNMLSAAMLDGTRYLQRTGMHAAILQVPLDAPAFDRVQLRIHAGGATQTSLFALASTSENAQAWRAAYQLAAMQLSDGNVVTLDILYEQRLAPLVVAQWMEPQTYRYRVDGTSPQVNLQAPILSETFTFNVSWSGADALTSISGFDVQVRAEGQELWTPWLTATSETQAVFSGAWGTTYELRARSLDGVGNPSLEWARATTTIAPQPAGFSDVNQPPTVRIVSPQAGDVLGGIVIVAWEANDPDNTPVMTTVQISSDDGATWRTLHSGRGSTFAWNTQVETDGAAYRIRATASDGTLSGVDATGRFTIMNAVLGNGALPGETGGQTQAPPAGSTGGSAVATDAQDADDAGGGLLVGGILTLVGIVAIAGGAFVYVRRSK